MSYLWLEKRPKRLHQATRHPSGENSALSLDRETNNAWHPSAAYTDGRMIAKMEFGRIGYSTACWAARLESVKGAINEVN